MSDGPSLSDFMRHLQAILEESEEISDRVERESRQFQIESAIQEAIIFGNRFRELKEHGIDPLHFVKINERDEVPQNVSKIETLNIGHDICSGCGDRLENDLDFCASCGEKR
jgi:muramoyltetrapeptide carboxypeptidase LdcA involved in peptidoglycan recycling